MFASCACSPRRAAPPTHTLSPRHSPMVFARFEYRDSRRRLCLFVGGRCL
jgi:hypothetical protein